MIKINKDKNWKPISPNNPNQTEDQGWRPVKYTKEVVTKELNDMLQTLKNNTDIVYIWELFEDKSYTRTRYSEWIKDYSQVKEIQRISCTIKEILETRAVKGAITNKLNANFTQFHLKNNYNWVDKQVNENQNTNTNYEVEDKWEFDKLLNDNKLI